MERKPTWTYTLEAAHGRQPDDGQDPRRKYPALATLSDTLKGIFGDTLPKNPYVAADFVLKLRGASDTREISALTARIAEAKETLCEQGLAVLRAERDAAKERVARSLVFTLPTSETHLSLVTEAS